jgi:hypothetical protein
MNRTTIMLAAIFVAATSNLALAQRSKTVTRTADPNTHTVSRTATETGPNGRTATQTRATTNNGDGTITHSDAQTGINGRTRSAVTTAGNGSATQTVTRRSGRVITRSRTRG